LRSPDHSHVATVGTTTGDYLIAREDESIAEHLDQLLVSERQVAGSDYRHSPWTGLLYKKQF